jgi:hypothetical protein
MGGLHEGSSAPGPGSEQQRPGPVTQSLKRAIYVVLVLLVCWLPVPMRSLWQDDTLLLRHARMRQGQGLAAALAPAGSPLRRLYTLPYSLAIETPPVVGTLHLLHAMIWLGQALAAGWIARLLLPGARLTRFLAICLTLTASSDYLTANLTALGYNFGALLLLLAIGSSLRFVTGGNVAWIFMASISLAASLWTIDVAIPALPFIPLLLFWRGGRTAWRRIACVVVAAGLAIAPALWTEWQFLRDPSGYAAVAVQPLAWTTRLYRTATFWFDNFAPWRWVFARPIFYPRPLVVIPLWLIGVTAGLASFWFLLQARSEADEQRTRTVAILRLAAILGAMTLIANAAYVSLQMAEIHYRTHIVSRIWASILVAAVLGWAIQRWPRLRAGFLGVAALFVGFGIWGGLERQDLWISTWRQHKEELRSIVRAAPALRPHTGVVLRGKPTPDRYVATEASYLATSWMVLLYDDPNLASLRIGPDRGAGCRPTPTELQCWEEGQAACVAAGTCLDQRYPYEALVLFDYDDQKGTWRLLTDPRGDPLLSGSTALARYRPESRILHRPLSPRQRALLLE